MVLPDTPTADEIELYLTCSWATSARRPGIPVLNVTVTNAEGMKADHSKDYILIGTMDDQPALKLVNGFTAGQDRRHRPPHSGHAGLLRAAAACMVEGAQFADHVQSAQLETAGGLPDALIEGLEWPKGSSQIHGRGDGAARSYRSCRTSSTSFCDTSQSSDIDQSVSVLHGNRFVSYRIGNDVYHVGTLSWWRQFNILRCRSIHGWS